jgi:hypothetical protein
MRRLARVALAALLLACAFGLYAFASWIPGAPPYAAPEIRGVELPHRFRTPAEHDATVQKHGRPYVLEIHADRGALVFYGARHTSDPGDPQMADIERRWRAFRPTVALAEGRRRGYFVGWPFDRLGGKGEPQLVHELARRDRVPVHSLEPAYEAEVAALLRSWTPEQVALYFTLRVYWSEAEGRSNDGLARHLLRKRTDVEGLRGSLRSVEDMDRVWRRDFASLPDWRGLRVEPPGTYLERIGEGSRRVRGEHMARLLIHLARGGERAFAVAGSGHIVRLEWILRAALGAPPASDQPEPSLTAASEP